MPFINCKVELSLKWIENCVLTAAAINADATYWNKYKVIDKIEVSINNVNEEK